MAWDPVPWLIGGDTQGGAEHSPEIMRMLAYYIMGGEEGVAGELDLRVMALSTPAAGYRVMPGAVSVLSRWQPLQEYIARMPAQTEEDSGPATSSAAGRSDLVVANIVDPFAPGSPWDPPADRRYGPYIHTSIITDVPQSTRGFNDLGITNWSALALARLDIPPSTRTIENSMIKDLRVVSNPITGTEPPSLWPEIAPSKVQTYVRQSPAHGQKDTINPIQLTYTYWPAAADVNVGVPSWATKVTYEVKVANAMIAAGTGNAGAFGDSRLQIGSGTGAITSPAQTWDFDASSTVVSNGHIILAGELDIPASLRGTLQRVRIQSRFLPYWQVMVPVHAGEARTSTIFEFNFRQAPAY